MQAVTHKTDLADSSAELIKSQPSHHAFGVNGAGALCVVGPLVLVLGDERVTFNDGDFISLPDELKAGTDYEIAFNPDLTLSAHVYGAASNAGYPVVGGFHYAPTDSALARAGASATPSINPQSIYDLNWRPACPDPRGMALVDGEFWCDIYLLGKNHQAEGTSRWGAGIADGDTLPRLNYTDAVAIMAEHGKQLLGVTEFWAATFGVKEKSSRDDEPETTEIGEQDLSFVSKWGIQQATGCMWVWGHDEDPDEPRASLFGGSWFDGSYAGSRFANLACWPGDSGWNVGARGRSDHLTHAN